MTQSFPLDARAKPDRRRDPECQTSKFTFCCASAGWEPLVAVAVCVRARSFSAPSSTVAGWASKLDTFLSEAPGIDPGGAAGSLPCLAAAASHDVRNYLLTTEIITKRLALRHARRHG